MRASARARYPSIFQCSVFQGGIFYGGGNGPQRQDAIERHTALPLAISGALTSGAAISTAYWRPSH